MIEDSLESKSLLSCVESFLTSAHKNEQDNKWILTEEHVETQILIDEIQDIQKSKEFESESFFTAYVTNITPLEEDSYAVHISYMGTNKESAALRANFELIAHKSNKGFLISSPLIRNTQNWKTKTIKNHTFHYPFSLEEGKVQEFTDWAVFYDEKLNNNPGDLHYYLCEDETNPLKLFGVAYKSDYNGDDFSSSWQSQHGKKTIYVLNKSGIYGFDTHDLWHNRLNQIIPRREVHHRVDCHIATLHGGIWGLSWEELFPIFSKKYAVGKNVDWLEHKKNKSHFITKGRHRNYSDDFVGALLIKEIEHEKGMDGVWQLLMTKRTREEEEYFSALASLIGITKKNYNKEVSRLVEAEKNRFGI
jgi:hypothetical protein